MCFELVELYLENSLFLVKARLCNDRINVQNQQGSRRFFSRRGVVTSSGIFAFRFNLHAGVFTYSHTCVLRCVSRWRGPQ